MLFYCVWAECTKSLIQLDQGRHKLHFCLKCYVTLSFRLVYEIRIHILQYHYWQLKILCCAFQDKNWEILETSRSKVDQFRRTMPLINDLKNEAMRPRHWDQIQGDMSRSFDSKADDFTLEKIIEWGFDQYAEKINDISGAASKELAIETGLKEINETWEITELDMITYKDKGHYKLK